MSNFTLQDVAGSAVAVVVFVLALYVPGYVLGYAANLYGFRRMAFRDRSGWAIAYSFAVTPLAGYLAGKYVGFNAACWLLLALALVWLVLLWRDRPGLAWTWQGTAMACAVAAWIAFVLFSLVDLQVGHKLYFSVAEDDQAYRVAFTGSVLRTGVPPANPLYFPGQAQPMRYYYFWYVVCAMAARIGHVTARQAFIASSVWAGLGMAAILGLYVRHFLGAVQGVRRQIVIAIALLAVTGADLLPAIGSIFGQTALNGDMEWWSNDQISSWADSFLWVPHHVASLLCCLVAFLLFWMGGTAAGKRDRIGMIAVAAIAIASAFGLSIYVAFGFALLMLAWVARLIVGRPRNPTLAAQVVATGVLSVLLLTPFLAELMGARSSSDSSAHTGPGHLFAISIRRFIDPALLTGLPVLASWNSAHPVLLDQAMRALLLLPGLALELGFYGAVLWLYGKHRRSYSADGPQRTALYLTGCGLLLALFVRSAVIGNNDFGYRVALLPQFFLLVLAADLLGSWWIEGRNPVVLPTAWRRKVAYGLIALGIAGTVYQVVLLRVFIPLEAGRPDSGFAGLPAHVFQARTAAADLERVSDRSAVVEFNPFDPHPGTGGDVVPPYAFYSRTLLMNANRQVVSAEPQCPAQFGGDSQFCAAIENSTQRLYASPAPSAQWAEEYCRQFGADYLAVGEMDPVWNDASGWPATLPAVVSDPGIRIARCSTATSSH
jgi:hypothetical protein